MSYHDNESLYYDALYNSSESCVDEMLLDSDVMITDDPDILPTSASDAMYFHTCEADDFTTCKA